MKKTIKLVLVLALSVLLLTSLTGCGAVGVYDYDSCESTNSDTASMIDALYSGATLELKKDGSGEMTVFGQSVEISWDKKGKTITMEGQSIPFKVSGKKLVIEEDGDSITFIKK